MSEHDSYTRPMHIYVSGPYSAPGEPPSKRQRQIERNIETADEIAVRIAQKGHLPFVPHTMMRGWEDGNKVERSRALDICKRWVEKCDALFYISKSPGAEEERQIAVSLGLPVYRHIGDIPGANRDSRARLSPRAVEAYLVEYQQCMSSYRHTYATIWQAGSIFAAISAAIIAFSSKSADGSIPWWIQLLTPLPILFWWWGIYLPMNRYGELRSTRLSRLEKLLSDGGAALDLKMDHFRRFDRERKGERTVRWFIRNRILSGRLVYKPRVFEVVTVFAFSLLILEALLILKVWPHLSRWWTTLF